MQTLVMITGVVQLNIIMYSSKIRFAAYETDSQSYNMLNLGVAYSGNYGNVGDYHCIPKCQQFVG